MNRGLLAGAVAALVSTSVFAQAKEVTIGYQDMVVPYRMAQEAKALEAATGYKINWRMFGGGGDVIKAMASGDVHIGEAGSSPITAAASQGQDIKLIWILDDIADAEALIVRNCHTDIYANRRWGQIARRGTVPHHTLDQYLAVGTGLETTRLNHYQKYRPNDPQRDVIWIHGRTMRRELQTLVGGRPAGYSAGLQMKVSMNGFQYIYRTDIRRAKYEVPLVYFDLCNDYYQLANAIYREDRELLVGVDLVRGKDVDPALHDRLCSYWWLVERLVRGQMTIDQLCADESLFDAYKKELLEDMGSQIITI